MSFRFASGEACCPASRCHSAGNLSGSPISRPIATRILAAVLISITLPVLRGTAHGAGPQGTVHQFTVPKQGSMYADPAYYAWIPADAGTLRTVIVHQHGCTREGDAQQMMGDIQWLSLAKKWNSAFIAPRLITGAPGSGSSTCGNWYNIANGSGNTFLAALDSLARRSGHPEIKTVPWALWGHSGGSMWITGMAGKYPERVAVAVAQSCGTEISNVPAALRIPILHHNGKSDICYNETYFSNGRTKGALWAHSVNPYPLWENPPPNFGQPETVLGHAPHDLRMIAIPWLEAGLAARLPATAGGAELRPMDTSGAWLGDKATGAVSPAAAFAGNKLAACWFPNQAFARLWAEYRLQGTLDDTSPTPAPRNLTGTYANRQITLKWDADGDLESGIKTFIVYRNGNAHATLQFSAASYFSTAKGFQRWQDGDQPVPSQAPAMTYTDAAVNDTGTFDYQVATVNWSDLPGMKSGTLTLKRGQVATGIRNRIPGLAEARPSLLACRDAGACRTILPAGRWGVHDLKGKLLARVEMSADGIVDLHEIMGGAASRLLLIKAGR